jgi:uncharacterized membrane protein YhaH (DUF805 family)
MYARSVDFGTAVRWAFQRYFDFRGRSQRAEYWWFFLFVLIGGSLLSFVDGVVFGMGDEGGPLSGLFVLATLIPSLSVGWRRLHDTGRSGLWLLLPYASLVWMIVALITLGVAVDGENAPAAAIGGVTAFFASVVWVIVLLCMDSEPRTNRYGPSPKYDEYADEARV